MDIEKILRGQITAADVLREQEEARRTLRIGAEASQLAYRSMMATNRNPYVDADQMTELRQSAIRLAATGFAGTSIDLSEIVGAAGYARRAMEAIYSPPDMASSPSTNLAGSALAALFSPPEIPGLSEALTRLAIPASSLQGIASAFGRVTGPQAEFRSSARRLADLFATEFSVLGRGAVRASLGDWREPIDFRPNLELPTTRLELYLDQGMSSEIAAVSADDSELNEYVEAALLDIEDDGNVRAYRLLMHVEQALRRLVRLVLEDVFGPKWWRQQVPPDVRERCEQKLQEALAAGADDAHPIDYADFTDYEKIICRSDNFKQAFQPIFGRVGDVRESLQRLHPVRLICMHSRIVRGADLVLVQFEAPRLLARVKPRLG